MPVGLVECEILDPRLKSRLRSDKAQFDERTAFKLEAAGSVRLLDTVSRWNPPRKTNMKNFDGNKPLIIWLEDQPTRAWGAEFSSKQVIKIGRALGHQIHYMSQNNFNAGVLTNADLIILNNFAFLDGAQFRILLGILFEQGVPYIRYEHDAFFCIHRSPLCRGKMQTTDVRCRNCANTKFHHYPRQLLMWKLFAGSILNVFISPLQQEIHMKSLGEVVNPSVLLLPPIDADFFQPMPGIKRQEDLIVSMTGKIWYANKGLGNLLDYVRKFPQYKFHVYTKPEPNMLRPLQEQPNVSIRRIVNYNELPKIYSQAAKVIHVPSWPEAAGRTIMEGFLCGCAPVLNENCGIYHFNFDWTKRELIREQIKKGPYSFWNEVCKVVTWEKIK